MHEFQVTRRQLIASGAGALAATSVAGKALAGESAQATAPMNRVEGRPGLTLFSRHLQWTGIEEAVQVAAEAGFGGIAWTVREGAHIAPENVARDLPRAVRLTRQAGLAVPLIVTAITAADSDHAESILDAAAAAGIHGYRAGSYRYDFKGDVSAQLDALRPRVGRLAQLNERYRSTALFHTQSGGSSLGGAVWDLWLLLRDLDPERVAINYDTGHAMIKGGSGWRETAHFARKHIRALSVKDFRWERQSQASVSEGSQWVPTFCVPGEGMVNFYDMFADFVSAGFNGPMEVHFEYRVPVAGIAAPVSLLGTDVGRWKLEMPKSEFVALLRRDVDFYARVLRATGLRPALG